MNPLTQSKNTTILPVLIALTLGCFGLSPAAQAVDPPPGGGYPGDNTAVGDDALFSLTTGTENTAIGFNALFNLTIGIFNTATGHEALFANTTGNTNTANGWDALDANTTGSSNTAIGCDTLETNSTGSNNIALGNRAGALSTGDNNILIGNFGVVGESGRIRIGSRASHKSTFIAGIFGVTVPTGVGVVIDNTGHLGTVVSSERFKDAIKPMDKASDAILALQPVTFHYKKELDPQGIPQFGLVAEQVEKVNPDLVARDDQGKPYTVRYEAVNAMLLNEFLKEHRKVEALGATVAAQQKGFESQIAALTAALKAQAAQIQEVSNRLTAQDPAPRVVTNN
jgi:hypothetical protein